MRPPGESVDIMLLLAEEAEHMMTEAGQLARAEAEEETDAFCASTSSGPSRLSSR